MLFFLWSNFSWGKKNLSTSFLITVIQNVHPFSDITPINRCTKKKKKHFEALFLNNCIWWKFNKYKSKNIYFLKHSLISYQCSSWKLWIIFSLQFIFSPKCFCYNPLIWLGQAPNSMKNSSSIFFLNYYTLHFIINNLFSTF